MKKKGITRIQDLLGLLNALYPPAYAEDWDNVGLQVGDPAAEVSRVMVCLDATPATLEAAVRSGAQALVSHHPLIFRPLKQVVPGDETGRVLMRAVRAEVAILSAHTNLDRAPAGLNDWLAARLGLQETVPLASGEGEGLVKLAVFVPAGYEAPVAEALFAAGAGHVGNYDRCAFGTAGSGTFRPGAGTAPFLGRPGKPQRTREVRLETIVPGHLVGRVLKRLHRAHPYEEAAYDLYPLANRRPDVGLGRLGRLAEPLALDQFADRVKSSLGAGALRVVGEGRRQIAKVAVCGGSGASLLSEAIRQGADVLVTGDLKYHEARNAESQGVAVIDAGHFATEQLMVGELAAVLRRAVRERDLEIDIEEAQGEADPFRTV